MISKKIRVMNEDWLVDFRKTYGDDVYDSLNKEYQNKHIYSKELGWNGTITGLWLPINKEEKRNRNLWSVTWDAIDNETLEHKKGIIELEDREIQII